VVGYELADVVQAGKITPYPGVERFTKWGVCFMDGRDIPFDTVILATGYRPTVQFVQSELDLDTGGYPLLDGWRSTRNPHLYCVGFWYSTREGWLQSIGRVARMAVAQIAAEQHRSRKSLQSRGALLPGDLQNGGRPKRDVGAEILQRDIQIV
jgi:NAD(P)H-nitrite reductase large subunit